MNRRFIHHLTKHKQNKLCYLLFCLTTLLLLSSCSEIIPSNQSAENSLAFKGGSGITPKVLDNEPNGTITNPPADINIMLGEKVYFSGSGYDSTGNYPLTYHWNFGNIRPNGLTQNPGFIQMNTLGSHRVSLTITNGIGISDATPDVRMINVFSRNSSNAPIANIDSPVGDLNIRVGDTVNFRGSGNSSTGNFPLTYFWNFAAAMPNSNAQNPGNLTFTQPGVYPVTLQVTNSIGTVSTQVASITITVNAETVTNLAPTANIISPPGDLKIKIGDSLYFTGTANDADSNAPLNFQWDFAGAAANSSEATPGKVVFSQVGIYPIQLNVTDALGLANINPPTRLITVTDLAVQNNMPLTKVITSPPTNITITAGESVNFQGEGSNGSLIEPLRYLWSFENSGMPLSTLQSPGEMIFDRPGEFETRLIIADGNGDVVAHETERTITVLDPSALLVHIHEPATSQLIDVGQSVNFNSMIINDPLGSSAYNYRWQFDGAAPDAIVAMPDPIIFTSPGNYKIKLTVYDPLTFRTAVAQVRLIRVVDPNALQARIINPSNNQMINRGDILIFSGEAVDPLGNNPLEFIWKFNGAAPDMAVQNPGQIEFNIAGEYRIQMIVRDPLTLRRTRTSKVTITVLDPNTLKAEISSPQNNKLIHMSESINFTGMGTDPLNDSTQFMYHWNFDRGISSTEQNPGVLTYNSPGTFEVEFSVHDPITNRRSPTVERMIHVMPLIASIPVSNTVKGSITLPAADKTIATGDTLIFESVGFDPNGAALNYHWNFNGAALNTMSQNPGSVMFTMPGVYTIRLTVTSSAGIVDPNPPFVTITVL